MKQKRKVEEIPDCYHQSMGWGNLHYPLVENIAERADILSTGRLARGMIGMRHAIRGAHKVPFGLPSLLHCDPETWPDDRDNTGIHALLMPLDKPTVPAFIHTKEELDGHGPMHWVGCNGDWVAFVQQDGHLTIRNIYISDTIIPLPSLQDAGISLGPTSEWWHGSPPFLFKYKIDKSLELLKVRIVKRPYKDDLAGPWHYEVIVVFDELIAILQAPLEKEWNILRNPEFFDRNSYVDAMGIPGYGTHAAPRLIDAPVIEDEEAEVAAIFAQIEGDAVMEDDEANVAQGDGGADEDNDADEEELEEEELEEDEFDDEELDDDGDNHNYEDEDVFLGFSDQRTWFLAPMRAESITGESDLAWIQVKAAGGTFMSITLGEATKLLDNMMINYSEWHTERAPQGKKVNSVEETSSLNDKIDAIMSMLVNDRTNIDPNNVPLASLVAQEEHVDVNFIKNNNFNNNAYRNNSSNNYRPYPYNNGNGYGNSYGNSYNNNRNTPPGLEAMLKEFISTQTAFNKSVEEKLGKIDILASKVDSLAADVDLLKSKVMPNENHHNKIVTTANAIQVRINENIRLMAELRARWDREENEKLAKEKNVAKVWTITTTCNANATHVAAPPTNTNKRIGVSNVSTSNAKREKLPETAKTAETACDKAAEIFSNIGDDDPIALDYNGLNFDDCHISEVIKFLQKLAKSPNASAINLAFTHHITNALIKAREEKLEREASIPKKLEDGWEPIIKMKVKDFDCNALCDLGASISVMPKKIYNMLDLPPLKNCYLDVNLADHSTKKPLGKVDNVRITVNNNLVPVDFVVLDIECNASCPIILGRPFLRTVGAIIDMKEGTHAAPRLIDAPVIEDEEAEVAAIFAQIEGDAVMEDDEANVAQGDGGADEDNDADEEELEEEELEEDEFDDEELDDDGDNHNYEDEDVFLGFSDQRTWFLAPMRAESITGESDLAWIQVKGYRPILGPPILHMGNKLRSYPLVRCYVFLRSAHTLDPVEEARFHVGAGIPGVAPHYIPPPSTFNVLLASYWFDKPWFLTEGNLLLYASHLPLGVPNERVLYASSLTLLGANAY
ncbi:hypothetical protein QYE76_069495 [Lolium multiflorum]|uniref:Uncharacterized protein n=1 Tax=Lolium multiflorum TaxID=4521 RepID=A0AAD8SIQ5_LOLMU|nr:hypothetical protein QYE76_069495 [Lolium multiflorum]